MPWYRWFPSILQVLTIIRPATLLRWHRAGFAATGVGRPSGGRPQIETELRALIGRMNVENPLWGAPRIHGELLKLGFEVAQSRVARYVVKRRGSPSQGSRTFLHTYAPDIAAMDHGSVVTRRLRAMGIRDKPTAPASPWQNGFAERLIGSIRRECVDHIIVLGEAHLRRILKSYARYYNETGTHLALDKNAPLSHTVQRSGRILCRPVLGGLHHEYIRI